MGLTRVGTRAQVDESIVGVGIARVSGFRCLIRFPPLLISSTRPRLDSFASQCANQEAIRFAELSPPPDDLFIKSSLFIKETSGFFFYEVA